MDTENILAEHANPFINSAVFCDQRWFDEREKEYLLWLNVLLTPPEQLNSSDELPKVDVADLLKKSCNSELSLAPSRETVSSRYLVNHRLDSVRRKACAMFRLPCVEEVLSKVIVQIDNEILRVRKDKKIVRDIGFNTTAVELLLCYNPLWLRIGLETITERTIPLESNSDRVGLIGFIARNILSDTDLVQHYACPGETDVFEKGFVNAMKKHIAKKCLLLVYFLDYAKENKLIFHNPGLFCKNAQYKGSHDLLLAIARELLRGSRNITERLRKLGYIVKHKQTHLDEFNYAVRHLRSDLQDGVRLTKVTEIILQESLSTSLHTPAISKLQKMHNVKLALTALSKAGHIEGLTAENIVEGHREKTMSLLWQIIYKFQLSRFFFAANTIQNWYRSLHICISRRIWIRKDATRRKVIEDAVIKIQKRFRDKGLVVLKIQRWYRACLEMKRQRLLYTSQQTAARKIQIFYRSKKMIQQHQKVFKEKRNAVLKIQQWYRACLAMKKQRIMYVKQRTAVQKIQMYYRRRKVIQGHRKAFKEKRDAVVKIQTWYHCAILMKQEREHYLKLRSSTIKIQTWFRATKLMRKQRSLYLRQRNAVMQLEEPQQQAILRNYATKIQVEPSENVTNQCRKKGPGVTQGSPGRIISFESRCTPGVPHTGSLLQVATESNMLKVAGANSVTKFIRTPSASGVSPVGILRIPEPGEYAVSANGTPLLVTSSVPDTVNINIPLKNGKRIIISPNADVIPNAIRDNLDADVKTKLKLLLNTMFLILKEE